MKKIMIAICLSVAAIWSIGALADDIGVVDMQTIFKSSPEVKAINASLKSEFSGRKASIVKMGQQLQDEVKKYQKNQSVMSKVSLAKLQQSINQHSVSLRQAQAKFQSDLMAAQNNKMRIFLNKVKSAVTKVANKKGLELVLPSNAVLYSKNKMDITASVLSALR